MFDVIRYIFETEQDIKLYYNQRHLVIELIEQRFLLQEISQAIDWFCPIIDAGMHQNYFYKANAIRSLDYLEGKYLSKTILNQILKQEKDGLINSFQRDILIDRLSVIAQEQIEEAEVQEILDKLVFHFSHYKFGLIHQEIKSSPTAWNTNFTLH